MSSEELDILRYLKSMPKAFFSMREICRRAGGKRVYRENPSWARPHLPRLVEKGLIETDGSGHYRIKSEQPGQPGALKAKRKWVSPQMARLLKASGKDFGEVIHSIEEDSETRN